MARGNPDFFGQASIITTGTWKVNAPNIPTIDSGDTYTIYNLTFKGVLQSLIPTLYFETIDTYITLTIQIDGGDLLYEIGGFRSYRPAINMYQNLIECSSLNYSTLSIQYKLKNNITINESLKITATPYNGKLMTGTSYLVYTEIE